MRFWMTGMTRGHCTPHAKPQWWSVHPTPRRAVANFLSAEPLPSGLGARCPFGAHGSKNRTHAARLPALIPRWSTFRECGLAFVAVLREQRHVVAFAFDV